MLPHSEVVAYIALLLLSTSPCAAWLCNVTLEGNASASPKLEISRAAVQCSPGLNEQRQQLAVSVATSAFLSEAEATFEGVSREPTSSNTSLLKIANNNVTFQNIELLNINASHVDTILLLTGANNTFSHVVSRGCHANQALLRLRDDSAQSRNGCTVIAAADFSSFTADAIDIINSCVIIRDSRFQNFAATALVVRHSNLTLIRTNFSDSDGRAAHIQNSNAGISHSQFDSLSFKGDGAALWVHNTMGGSTNLTACIFTNNQAIKGFGGAAFIYSYRPSVWIEQCIFQNNSCEVNGGAVSLSGKPEKEWPKTHVGGNFTIVNSTFLNNTAHAFKTYQSGGVGHGGAIYHEGSYGANDEMLYIINNTLVGNHAPSGGAVCTYAVKYVNISQSTFLQNTAHFGRGGALYVYGSTERYTLLWILNSKFLANNATNIAPRQLPGIFDVGECAGAHISSCSCVGVLNSTFDDNTGIGLCVRDVTGTCEKLGIGNPLFVRNSIVGKGNAQMIKDFIGQDPSINLALDIRSCVFRRNTAVSLVRIGPEPALPDPLAGGAGLDIIDATYLALVNLVFEDNMGRQGSGVHLDSYAGAVMWNCTLAGNTATQQGGAIASVNSHGKGVMLGASTIKNNQALTGGAFYGDSGASLIVTNNTQLINNTAVTNGGAVSCEACQEVKMQLDSTAVANVAQEDGGAAFCTGCTKFTLDHAHMMNNRASNGGAVHVVGTSPARVTFNSITGCSFDNNTANASSGSAPPFTGDGGALFLDGGVTSLLGTSITGNSAGGRGGGVAYVHQCFNFSSVPGTDRSDAYLWVQQHPQLAALAGNCSLVQSWSVGFVNNYASVAGGAVYSTHMPSLNMTCRDGQKVDVTTGCPPWSNNTVRMCTDPKANATCKLQGYGPLIASVPARMRFVGQESISQYVSDGHSALPVNLSVWDQANNSISSALSVLTPLRAVLSVANTSALPPNLPQPELQGQTQAEAHLTGTISIADVSLLAVPGNYNVSAILPDHMEVPAAALMVSVRPCVTGEYKQTEAICAACPASTYSFNSSNSLCDPCPANGNCSAGANLVPMPGYWHSAPDSDWIVPCPNSEACQGNSDELLRCKKASYDAAANQIVAVSPPCNLNTSMASTDADSYMVKQCKDGYYGPVCSLCLNSDSNGTRFGKTGTATCKPCRSSGVIVCAYLGSTLLVLLWLMYTIEVTLQENREDADGVPNPGRISELIRALTLWLQYITLLGNVSISAPKPIHWVFSVASFAFSTITSGSLSTDCLLSGSTNLAVQRVLLHLAVLPIVLLVLVLLQTLWWCARPTAQPRSGTGPILAAPVVPSATATPAATGSAPSTKHAELPRRLMVTLLTTTFFYYPSLLTTSLSLFQCYHIDPTSQRPEQRYPQNAQANWKWGYWVPDMSVKCFDGWHLGFALGLGIPLLVLVFLVIPFLPVFLLFNRRRRLFTTSVKLRLGFIYHSYRARFWFWDSIVLLQTLALAASQVFATSLNTYFQLTIMLMMLVIGITVLAHFRPFEERLSQSMQVLGLFTVVATATGCLYFLDQNRDVANSKGLTAAGVLLLILNVFYVVLMATLIIKKSAPRVKEWVAWCKHHWGQFLGRVRRMQCWSPVRGGTKLRSASSVDAGMSASLSRRSSELSSWRFPHGGTSNSATAGSD